jgi:hypothetical protein
MEDNHNSNSSNSNSSPQLPHGRDHLERLLEAALEVDPPMVLILALQVFSGLRKSQSVPVAKLEWEERLGQVFLKLKLKNNHEEK